MKTTKMSSKKRNRSLQEKQLSDLGSKLDETDEMKIRMLEAMGTLGSPEADEAVFPAELNAHLLEQLKIMTCENNKLRQLLFTRDKDLEEMNHTVTDLNTRIRDIISGTGPTISAKSAGIISAKITDLCKQNRHLVAECEGLKTRNAALERKIMQQDILVKDREKHETCTCKDEPPDTSPEELKELNQKLAAVNKRLIESKNKNLDLKNEIIAATKILQQELGDKFTSLKELQNHVMGWKGRAEKIIILQARINELEEKLNLKEKEKERKRLDQGQIIKELEAKRKREVDQVMKDFKQFKDENQELKKKLEAMKCRVRNVECDATTHRQKMQTFIEKSNADDQLINEQRNQIKALELYYQEILKENTHKMNKMQAEIQEYQKAGQNTDAKIDALRKQASEKTAKIDELRAQLLRYEECSLQNVFFNPMKTATDNEIQKLTELVSKQNERLNVERQKWEELETVHRKLKEKKKRLEKKVERLEDELKKAIEVRKGSRTSKSSIPKEPIYDALSSQLSVGKRPSGQAVPADKPSDSTLTSGETPQDYANLEKDELKYKLELTEEKLKIFEDKLKMIEEEKLEDFNHLTEMIQNSKQLFNEALAVLQKEKCLCH